MVSLQPRLLCDNLTHMVYVIDVITARVMQRANKGSEIMPATAEIGKSRHFMVDIVLVAANRFRPVDDASPVRFKNLASRWG